VPWIFRGVFLGTPIDVRAAVNFRALRDLGASSECSSPTALRLTTRRAEFVAWAGRSKGVRQWVGSVASIIVAMIYGFEVYVALRAQAIYWIAPRQVRGPMRRSIRSERTDEPDEP